MNGKLPPQALELEEAVLSACMVEAGAYDRISKDLQPADFYKDAHRLIYESIVRLAKDNKPIDILTITADLKKAGKLDAVGGAYAISQLSLVVTSSANMEYHAKIVKEKAMLRSFITIASEDLLKAFDDGADPFKLTANHQLKVEKIHESITPEMSHIKSVGEKTLENIRKASERGGDLIGYPSNLKVINQKLLGYSGPDYIIVAGGPGEGKSTAMLNDVINVAQSGVPCAVFSMEMNDEQLYWKILSRELNIPVSDIRRGRLSSDQWDTAYRVQNYLADLPIYFYDISGLDVDRMIYIVKDAYRKFHVRMVFIDYIQLLTVGEKKAQNREGEVNYISKSIKKLCRELNIPIMALSQLKRRDKATKELYGMHDLRESGSLEQDADVIMMFYRPERHGLESLELWEPDHTGRHVKQIVDFAPDDVIIVIPKCRLGNTGVVRAKCDLAVNRFYDLPARESIADLYTQPTKETDDRMPF